MRTLALSATHTRPLEEPPRGRVYLGRAPVDCFSCFLCQQVKRKHEGILNARDPAFFTEIGGQHA